MSLDPLITTDKVVAKYIDYLTTTFSFKDKQLQNQLLKELKTKGKFAKGPILEATPPYKKGLPIIPLIEEGLLSKEFKKLKVDEALPLGRTLFLHQEKAIRKIIADDRNCIVATGTGSGKTETFLIPILNHLFRQHESKELTAGVRALLLYPMNALANDQLKRMRKLLKNYPLISFGSYTGETEEKYKDGLERYQKMHNGQNPLENELISREQMKDKPPNILLTNYAMLEYLMLRPKDNVFFDGQHANFWKFIVIDEAHTYTGAKAIEMSMLLRRLKTRVIRNDNKLKCIATSATIGKGEKDFPQVADFAQKLFGEPFQYVQDDLKKQDIIKAEKKKMRQVNLDKSTGEIKASLYFNLKNIIEKDKVVSLDKLIRVVNKAGIAEHINKKAQEKAINGDWKKYLYFILKEDYRLIKLQNLLEKEPQYLEKVANDIFYNIDKAKQYLIALVYLANKAKNEEEQPLLPARYHLFVRAIEGAYLSFRPEKKLYLERKEKEKEGEKEYPIFEIAICRNCNILYLVGETKIIADKYYLKQPGQKFYEDRGNLNYYLVLENKISQVTDNEDELEDKENNIKEEYFLLCPSCGNLNHGNALTGSCNCKEEKIMLLSVSSKKGLVHKCIACGGVRSQSSIISRFLLGGDAVSSVLSTSLYQQLPGIKKVEGNEKEENNIEKVWGNSEVASTHEHYVGQEHEKRQLLIFSDSRQDAAFFATYLESTYKQIVRRQLILKIIKENKLKLIENNWRIKDLVVAIKSYLLKLKLYKNKSSQEIENLAWKWVLYEFLALDRKNSLESLGLLGFSLVKPDNFAAPPLTIDPWNLSSDESWILFQILLDSFRKYGAVSFPDNVSPEDNFFEPRNRGYYFKELFSKKESPNVRKRNNIKSWLPSNRRYLNSRLDYIIKLAQETSGGKLNKEDCINWLEMIWKNGLAFNKSNSMFKNYFSIIHGKQSGQMYRIKLDYWQLYPSIIDKSLKWYYCSVCNRFFLYNIRGVCPTYRCSGKLVEANPEELLADNHYRNLYLDEFPLIMKTSEHTAQLTTEAAANIQSKFNEGEINVLSCSTTFELGVDVGELESVLMRNVPPTAANYIQRAGRAGRRTDSTAFSLTFAQRKSHDLTYFKDPLDMISGKIKPPYFALKNIKIIARHVYASALAFFWKKEPAYFKKVKNFFFTKGYKEFENYILNHPKELKIFIKNFVPKSMHDSIGLDNWGWFDDLIGQDGVMTKVKLKLNDEVSKLKEVQAKYVEQANYSRANMIQRVIRTIENRPLINFMSQNNIIPKYGFPVDVVELKIEHHGDQANNLDLNRDLKIALSEYAPGSQVIAGGSLWTSRYLKLLPDRNLLKYRYAICDQCGNYQSKNKEIIEKIISCEACGSRIGRKKGVFINPEFGFISEEPSKPSMKRPEKTYSTRQYFTGEYKEKQPSEIKLNLNNIKIELIPASQGKMAVINHAGLRQFSICKRCGHAVINGSDIGKHFTPWGDKCNSQREFLSLGYEFYTDILQLRFNNSFLVQNQKGFWESILYGMLEGISLSMDIERRDIDGCLFPYLGDPSKPALVFYDIVPGGAGHVKRIVKKENFKEVIYKTFLMVNNCQCGGKEGDSSCYGCLRNYSNEYCHDNLKRKFVIELMNKIL